MVRGSAKGSWLRVWDACKLKIPANCTWFWWESLFFSSCKLISELPKERSWTRCLFRISSCREVGEFQEMTCHDFWVFLPINRIPCSALKIGKNGCRSSHMDTPFTTNIFIAFTNVKLHFLLNEICPPTEVSTVATLGEESWWRKSSIHHQAAPKTFQFQSLRIQTRER